MSYFAFPGMDYTLSWRTQWIHTTERTTEKAKTDEIECNRNPTGCMSYKKDASDGDYYG